MSKYLMLSRLSEQGLQTLRANPDRLREVNKDVEELGRQGPPPVVRPRAARLREHRRGPEASAIAKVSSRSARAGASTRSPTRCSRSTSSSSLLGG